MAQRQVRVDLHQLRSHSGSVAADTTIRHAIVVTGDDDVDHCLYQCERQQSSSGTALRLVACPSSELSGQGMMWSKGGVELIGLRLKLLQRSEVCDFRPSPSSGVPDSKTWPDFRSSTASQAPFRTAQPNSLKRCESHGRRSSLENSGRVMHHS
jgi:hypothetical protein